MRTKPWIVIGFPIIFLLNSCGGPSSPSLPNPSPKVHFFSFGDWGTGDTNQQAVADETQNICRVRGCDFGLFLGDNFYDNGVLSVDDPQWQTKYRDLYSALGIPLYAILGNHDWDSPANPQAQVDFDLQDKDPFWRMPAFYYSFRFPDSGDPVVEIFVINSNNFASDSVQQTWLSQALSVSAVPWKILALHHPIWDNGEGHVADSAGVYPTLKPLICGRVDLLLAGHEHNFQHLRDEADGCGYDQLIVGTGGRSLYDIDLIPDQPTWTIHFAEKSWGLGFFDITPTTLTFQFLRPDGSQVYTTAWQKP